MFVVTLFELAGMRQPRSHNAVWVVIVGVLFSGAAVFSVPWDAAAAAAAAASASASASVSDRSAVTVVIHLSGSPVTLLFALFQSVLASLTICAMLSAHALSSISHVALICICAVSSLRTAMFILCCACLAFFLG